MKILISSVRHETTDVDVGDALGVLQTFGKAQVLLVGPECGNSTRNGRLSDDEFIQVDHLIALIVLGLHWLNWTNNVCLTVKRCMVWVSGEEVVVRSTVESSKVGVLIVLDPGCSRCGIEISHAWLIAQGSIVVCHTTLCQMIVTHVVTVHGIACIRSVVIVLRGRSEKGRDRNSLT